VSPSQPTRGSRGANTFWAYFMSSEACSAHTLVHCQGVQYISVYHVLYDEVSIRCQKTPEVWYMAYTPNTPLTSRPFPVLPLEVGPLNTTRESEGPMYTRQQSLRQSPSRNRICYGAFHSPHFKHCHNFKNYYCLHCSHSSRCSVSSA